MEVTSYLYTVDALTPWYAWRHTPNEVRRWFEELGYEYIEVGRTPCSVKGWDKHSTEMVLLRNADLCVV
jgi:hypothetical protein